MEMDNGVQKLGAAMAPVPAGFSAYKAARLNDGKHLSGGKRKRAGVIDRRPRILENISGRVHKVRHPIAMRIRTWATSTLMNMESGYTVA